METEKPSSFGALVRYYRRLREWSQEEVADKSGLSLRTLNELERDGVHVPRPDTMARLAQVLGLGPAERAAFAAAARRPPARDLPSGRADRSTGTSLPLDIPPLPVPMTRLLGRERELAEVPALLGQDDVRLVTLTGAGGSGKTRLALGVVHHLQDTFPDGVAFVALAPLADPELVVSTIAQGLGLRDVPGQSWPVTFRARLRNRRLLVVVDNFEQLLPAAPHLVELLEGCPGLKLLVTSRAALRVSSEHEYPVPPLGVPDPRRPEPLERVAQYPSVALFVARARAVQPDFRVTKATAPAIADICRRLDGLPLAIELAAARIRLLDPEAILARLARRLPLLTGGARDLPERQRTLRATLDWSHALLAPADQRLFARLAVFAGGFTLDAAEAVCATGSATGDLKEGVLDGLETLMTQSLVQRLGRVEGEARFTMLETVREYALEQLALSGETDATRDRHATYFLTFAEALTRDLYQTGENAPYFAEVLPEMANVRATLRWYHQRKLAEAGLRAVWAVGKVWDLVGPRGEGWDWSQRFLTLAETQSVAPEVRTIALYGAGWLALRLGDLETSQRLLQQLIDLAEKMKDPFYLSAGLSTLGWLLLDRHELAQAQAVLGRSLTVAHEAGNADAARSAAAAAQALILLGDLSRFQGDDRRARTFYETTLSSGAEWFYSWAHRNLGYVALHEGNLTEALSLLGKSLWGCEARGNKLGIVECLAAFAAVAVARNDGDRAARLLGALETALQEMGGTLYFGDRFEHAKTLASLHATLADDVVAMAFEQGRTMTLEEAVEYALKE